MSNIIVPASGTNPVATVTVSRDSTTEHIQLINITDQSANDAVGNAGTGIAQPTGGVGILGFLSGIFNKLSGTLTVQGSFTNSAGPAAMAVADTYVSLNITTATTTTVISGVSAKSIYVTGYEMVSNGGGTIQIVQGASNTPVTGPMAVAQFTGISRNGGVVWKIPAGNSLAIITTGSATVQGSISYAQY